MKFRTATELQDFLDKNLSKRKQELTTLHFSVQNSREHERAALLRAILPLLYAHWEGFIKTSSTAYISYVSRQGILLKNLNLNFVALACRREILAAAPTRKMEIHRQIIASIVDNFEHTVPLSVDNAINTEANLSSLVLKDIMETVGIDYDEKWQKKEIWIDQQLLKNRNGIAHGDLVSVDDKTYQLLHQYVVDALDEYKAAIENAVALKAYLKNT